MGLSLEAVKAERAKRRAEAERQRLAADFFAIRSRCQSLAGFVKEAWHVLEPSNPLKWSWHLDAMCSHLEAISRGQMTPWLIINVPPGSSKSMIVSVLWQAWEWGPFGKPSTRFLTTSFELENVKRDTRKTRDLILSDWYRALWPGVVLTRTAETSFANGQTGSREGVPFASVTGKRGDRLVVDDPHSLKGAESEAERSSAVRLFLEGGLNRLNDQTTSAIVVVMQRVHEADLTGALMARDLGFVHLMIPMEFEAERRCSTAIGWSDPRAYEGELMDPVRMPREAVDKLKNVSAYSWAGQYQQRPAPRDGGMFQRYWFNVVAAVPAGAQSVRRWDLAATAAGPGTDPDWTVGLRMARDGAGLYYIEDVRRFRGSPMQVEQAITGTAAQDDKHVRIGLPQDPGQAGKMQVQHLIRALAGYVVQSERETGSKLVRAAPFAAQAEAGNVFLIRGAWNEAFLAELEVFPSGSHDDQVDAASGAFDMLTISAGHKFDFA